TYVNLEDILHHPQHYINHRAPDITPFQPSSTSHILPIHHFTHTLKPPIQYFAQTHLPKLPFLTKFHHLHHLLDPKHNRRTTFPFTINPD
ncbi:spore photoproduct lyase family protein, partial [Bacillus altitudinis]|uniref:spore photoproduct lyase family protein n=1 Tax=Bacillus altitudinis TaxID=293387 RepID=UPI00307EB640